jgi:hypothetical protein
MGILKGIREHDAEEDHGQNQDACGKPMLRSKAGQSRRNFTILEEIVAAPIYVSGFGTASSDDARRHAHDVLTHVA